MGSKSNVNNIKVEQPDEECLLNKKDQKKLHKLEAQIPYHIGRGNSAEVEKIKGQVAAIWAKVKTSNE